MKLNRPKDITFIVAAVLAVLGLIGAIASVPVLTAYSFWLVVIGFIVLAAGNMVAGL
jgi:hypothetical protein